MDDCKSFRSYQMLGGTADGVFLYALEMITTQMILWAIFQVLGTRSTH